MPSTRAAAPSLPSAPSEADDDAFHRAALRELVAIGTELARDLRDARRAEPPALTHAEAADAFERLARAVRRTILLAAHLRDAPRREAPARAERANRRVVIRAVEDALTAEPDLDPAERRAREAEFRERLDAPEFAEDLAALPLPELIAGLLRDLDLGRQPWVRLRHRRRTPAAIRALHALAAGTPCPLPAVVDPAPAAPSFPPRELHALILSRAASESRDAALPAAGAPPRTPPGAEPLDLERLE